MAISLESADATNVIPQTERCLNCGAELSGEFCNQCGQKKVHRHDFSIKHFFGHLLHEFTHLDSNKILKTLYALVFRPGLLTAEYLAGRKGRYINPIRIYLTFSALYFLFAWGVLYEVRGGGSARMVRNPSTIAMARQRGIEPIALGERIQQKAEKYAAGLRFGSVLISGLFLSVLFIGVRRYYVEHLIFSLHYYSFDFLCKSIFAVAFIVSGAFGFKLPSLALDLFYPVAFIYLLFALRRVYLQSWVITGMKAVVLFVCETLLFIAVNMAGFIIAFTRV